MAGCCQAQDEVFGERTARHDLRRYRRRGPSKPTRMLLEALEREGIEGATVLDIGGGVGAIQQELLAAGAAQGTAVEASDAYLSAAAEEAERRGQADRVRQLRGDFVELAGEVEPADVVTLDRVICCYPDMEALVGRSADRARRLYGSSIPATRGGSRSRSASPIWGCGWRAVTSAPMPTAPDRSTRSPARTDWCRRWRGVRGPCGRWRSTSAGRPAPRARS